jgi:serine kinase of HPr protein (carbohydrate metabolism regulator)
MRKYITRVKLKDAEKSDYERLDSEMEKERFARVKLHKALAKDNPVRTREYNFHGGITIQQVTAAAYRAASKTGKKYSFTVMKEKAVISS